jgi:isoamylase
VTTQPGNASPLGASATDNGFNFAVYVDGATQVNLCFYTSDGKLAYNLPMQRSESVWHLSVGGDSAQYLYCFEVEREGATQQLSDPYAKNLNLLAVWRKRKTWPAPSQRR